MDRCLRLGAQAARKAALIARGGKSQRAAAAKTIVVAIMAGALAAVGYAYASGYKIYTGTTSQKADYTCTQDCPGAPIKIYVRKHTVVSADFGADYAPAVYACEVLDNYSEEQSVTLAIPIKKNRFKGTANRRINEGEGDFTIEGRFSGKAVSGWFSDKNPRDVSVDGQDFHHRCRTGRVTYSASR